MGRLHKGYAHLHRELSLLLVDEHGCLVLRLFMCAECRLVRGLKVVRGRYLFFAC